MKGVHKQARSTLRHCFSRSDESTVAQLYFYYSAMNAGKSTSLLQSAHNYQEQGMDVMLFTAAIDDRYGQGVIKSRIGLGVCAGR